MAVFRWKDVNADYVYVGPWEKETVGRDFSKDKNIELVYQNSFVKSTGFFVDDIIKKFRLLI